MFCTNCGKQIADTAAFCPNCGKPVSKPAVQPGFIPVPPVQAPVEIPQPQEAIPAAQEAVQKAVQPVYQPAADAVQETVDHFSDVTQSAFFDPNAVNDLQDEIPEIKADIPEPQDVVPEVQEAVQPAVEAVQPVVENVPFAAPEIPQGDVQNIPVPNPAVNPNYYPPQDPAAAQQPQQPQQPQQYYAPPYPPQGDGAAPKQKKEKGPKKSIFKNKFFYIGLAAVLLVAAGIVLFLLLGGSDTYNLKDYLKVEFDGYEGNGEAIVSIDQSALEEKIYEDKDINLDSISSFSGYAKMLTKAAEIDEALRSIKVQADPSEGLKNGDEITVTFTFDKDAASKQKIKFVGEDQKITVEGLPALKEFDPFADLTVTFVGNSGSGEAKFEYSGEDDFLSSYSFDVKDDAQYHLKNGDEITVVLESYYDDETAAYYGLHLTKREQNYTVSGLSEYISDFSQISAAGLELLRQHASEDLDDALDDIDSAYTVGAPEYAGYAIGIADDEEEYTRNYLYLIYKAKISMVAGKTMPATLYLPVKFDNITSDDELADSYSYGVKGYDRLIGSSDYFSGYFNPYDLTAEIRDSYTDYTFTFGDGFEAYDKEAVSVTSFSDIPKDVLSAAGDYVVERVKSYVTENYYTTTTVSEITPIGEYLFVANDQTLDMEDRAILVTVIKMKVVDTEKKVDTVLYMPFEFDGLLKTEDGIYCLSYGSDIFAEDELASDYPTAGMIDVKTLDSMMKAALADTYTCTPSDAMNKEVGQ